MNASEAQNTIGRIDGLLEAWTDRGDNLEWGDVELSDKQKSRLVELFNLLPQAWIVLTMSSGMPSDYQALQYLARLV